MPVPFLACMAFIAGVNHLPPRVLPSIQAVEGGAVGTVHRNTDGSEDLGVMQINTRWLPALAVYFGMKQDAVRANLVHAPCFNIAAAGAVLRHYLDEAKGDLMLAIGYYHSHTMPLNLDYRARVVRSAAVLFGTAQEAAAARHGAVTRSQE